MAYPSALVILKTAQKLAMLLEMVEVPENFEVTRSVWAKAIKDLGKTNTKWARLNALPGSLVRLVHTELDLTVMSIPDHKVIRKHGNGVTTDHPSVPFPIQSRLAASHRTRPHTPTTGGPKGH